MLIVLCPFQFQTGSIKRQPDNRKVWRCQFQFQFQTGSIKSNLTPAPVASLGMFQFQTGSIKSNSYIRLA